MRYRGGRAFAVGLAVAASMLSACTGGSGDDRPSRSRTVDPARAKDRTATTSATPTPPVPPVARDFAWADGGRRLPEAYCLTLVRGLDPIEALNAVTGETVVTDARQAVQDAESKTDGADGHYFQAAVALRRGGWTYVLEDNGFLATEDPTTQRLSKYGAALVVFENVEADSIIRYARAGHLVREFDPLLYDRADEDKLPQERGLPFGTKDAGIYHLNALKLTFVRRLTGVTLRPSDFDLASYQLGVVVRY